MNRMIHFFFLFIAFPIVSFSQKTTKTATESFIPLKIGNYWVYSSSIPSDKLDTVKITKERTVELGKGYYINNQLWVEKNDSVYIFQSGRGGTEFPTLQYFPSERETSFGAIIGGDVRVQRTVTKINGTYTVNGK